MAVTTSRHKLKIGQIERWKNSHSLTHDLIHLNTHAYIYTHTQAPFATTERLCQVRRAGLSGVASGGERTAVQVALADQVAARYKALDRDS